MGGHIQKITALIAENPNSKHRYTLSWRRDLNTSWRMFSLSTSLEQICSPACKDEEFHSQGTKESASRAPPNSSSFSNQNFPQKYICSLKHRIHFWLRRHFRNVWMTVLTNEMKGLLTAIKHNHKDITPQCQHFTLTLQELRSNSSLYISSIRGRRNH